MDSVRKALNSPYMALFVGIVLVVTSAREVWVAFEQDLAGLGGHHGVLVFGIFTLLKAFIDLSQSSTKFKKDVENI